MMLTSRCDWPLLVAPPAHMDPWGRGELHTFVNGSIIRRPMDTPKGEVVERDGIVCCDLLADFSVAAPR